MRFTVPPILTIVFFVFTTTLHGQVLGNIDVQKHRPYSYCEDSALACFSDLLNHSEYIFEGTCIDSRFIDGTDGKFYIGSTYEIHKNFKKEINTGQIKLYSEAIRPDKYNEKGEGIISVRPGRYYTVLTKLGTTGIIVAENTSIRPEEKVKKDDTFLKGIFILRYHLTQDTPTGVLNRKQIAFVRTMKKDVFKFSSTDQIYETILNTNGTALRDLTKKVFQKN